MSKFDEIFFVFIYFQSCFVEYHSKYPFSGFQDVLRKNWRGEGEGDLENITYVDEYHEKEIILQILYAYILSLANCQPLDIKLSVERRERGVWIIFCLLFVYFFKFSSVCNTNLNERVQEKRSHIGVKILLNVPLWRCFRFRCKVRQEVWFLNYFFKKM